MSQHIEILNARRHQNLCLSPRQDYAFVRHQGQLDVLLPEFRQAAGIFPIVFVQDGQHPHPHPVLLLDGQRRVSDDGRWLPHYLPLVLKVYPFALGRQEDGEAVVCIDRNSALLTERQGQPLFLDDGTHTPALQQITRLLSELHHARNETLQFCRVLAELNLYQPLTTQAGLPNACQINRDRLENLNPATLGLFRKKGWLAPAYMHLVSLETHALFRSA